MKATGDIQCIPIGSGVSVRMEVKRAHAILEESGLHVTLHPNGTIVEGGQVVAGADGHGPVARFERSRVPSRVPAERRFVGVPAQPNPQPAFGLGALFGGGGGYSHSAAKPAKNNFLWPGDEAN